VACSPASGSFFPVGMTTVTCTANRVDPAVLHAPLRPAAVPAGPSCKFRVIVTDNTPPVLNCPNVMQNNDLNQCGAVVNYGTNSAIDNCTPSNQIVTMCSPAAGSFFAVGTTTVNCTAKDAVNNTGTCSFTVKIIDAQAPVFTNGCPAAVTVTAAASCPLAISAAASFTTPVVSDNCPGVTVSCNPPSGAQFPVGATTVTCTATDASNNSTTCTFGVNVFSFCLQDDSILGNVVFVNAITGDYLVCSSGVAMASGRGTVTVKACSFDIDSTKGNRKVHIHGDTGAANGAGVGTAFIQKADGSMVLQITDKNMTNNACSCSPTQLPGKPRDMDPGNRINGN
jgi:hypothetical protein